MQKIVVMLGLCLPLLAQGPPQPRQQTFTELKAFLTLTDQQVTELQSLMTASRNANNARLQEMRQKQSTLRQQLEAGTTDAAAVGRLMLDIESLRKQVDATNKDYSDQAVNVLNAAQKTKLQQLVDASKLAPTITQAVGLRLMSPPDPPFGVEGGGRRGFPGMPGGPGGFRGPRPRMSRE